LGIAGIVLDQEIEKILRTDLLDFLFSESLLELVEHHPIILDRFFPQKSPSGSP
jgi:hypothetical protein